MRKPRNFDSEMKALNDRAKLLKERKLHQLGELVIATGADVLAIDLLAGAMLVAADTKDTATLEVWRERGATFFQLGSRSAARRNRGGLCGAPTGDSSARPTSGEARAK